MSKNDDSETLFLSEDGNFLTDQAGNNVAQKINVNGKEVFQPIMMTDGRVCIEWGTKEVCLTAVWDGNKKVCVSWGEKPWCITWES
jgi:hypothetical protein